MSQAEYASAPYLIPRRTGTFGPARRASAIRYGCPSQSLEITINSPRRRINPRLIAPIAFIVAFTAIALEIAYAIGGFFTHAAEQIR